MTDLEARAGRAEVLAALSSVFAEAVVDEQRLLDAIAQHVGAAAGDACVIRLLEARGQPGFAVWHAEPAVRERLRQVSAAAAPDPSVGVWRTLLEDRAVLRVSIDPDRLPPGLTEQQRALLRTLPLKCSLGVPLLARGRVLGAIFLVRLGRPERYTQEEEALLTEVAARAALAIDNARLWAAERLARQHAERAELALRAELAERQRAEERLRESEEQLRLLFQNVVDYAMVLLDTNGRVISWNVGAERMTGWPASEVVGRPVAMLGPEENAGEGYLASVLDRVRAEGRAELSMSARRRSGTPYELNAVVTPVRGENGALRGFAAVMRDVTLLRDARVLREMNALLEARTRELAAANQELEAFIYSVSHDLRAPLRAIDGFSEAVLSEAPLDAASRAHLGRVRAAAGRMQQLIDDLLLLSRSTRGELNRRTVDAARIAGEVLAELRTREPDRHVECTVPETGTLCADPRFLRIVVENLLGNAWKFTRGKDPAHIAVEVVPDGEGTRFTVRDDGAGFEESQAGRLFQPFQRLHRPDEFEGTGIGLAIVRRILNRHGGRAWAEGHTGGGAAVHVWFPRVAAEAVEAAPAGRTT